MALKPIDVRRKEFKNSMRGYNADQVDDFLDTVADEFERSYSENLRMREEITSLRERLEQFEKLEDSIQSALVHAESAANDLRESASSEAENVRANAEREAELTKKEATERAQQTLADSSSKVERANESYEALKKAKQDFAADFRHLLKSYIAVMDNVDLVSAKDIEASLRERLDWEAIAAAREAADKQNEEDDTEDTQAMDRGSGPLADDEAEPEVEEPEIEPSSVDDEGEEAVATDSEAVEEVKREESSPESEEEPNGGSNDNGSSQDSGSEERASRASRFLRRRD
ncbi:MAG: DivIVA domain-containing protein [Rubrobacteraceae bacterium]